MCMSMEIENKYFQLCWNKHNIIYSRKSIICCLLIVFNAQLTFTFFFFFFHLNLNNYCLYAYTIYTNILITLLYLVLYIVLCNV